MLIVLSIVTMYVPQSAASYDAYNAETEAPNAEDVYIATIEDSEQRVQL